jgi:hypothetical protein
MSRAAACIQDMSGIHAPDFVSKALQVLTGRMNGADAIVLSDTSKLAPHRSLHILHRNHSPFLMVRSSLQEQGVCQMIH